MCWSVSSINFVNWFLFPQHQTFLIRNNLCPPFVSPVLTLIWITENSHCEDGQCVCDDKTLFVFHGECVYRPAPPADFKVLITLQFCNFWLIAIFVNIYLGFAKYLHGVNCFSGHAALRIFSEPFHVNVICRLWNILHQSMTNSTSEWNEFLHRFIRKMMVSC